MFLSLIPIFIVLVEMMRLRCVRFVKSKQYADHSNNESDNIKFLEMNGGPEYNLQIKTGSLNACIFICFSLGTALPFLYVIGLFAIAV